jgi:hypothetical protein
LVAPRPYQLLQFLARQRQHYSLASWCSCKIVGLSLRALAEAPRTLRGRRFCIMPACSLSPSAGPPRRASPEVLNALARAGVLLEFDPASIGQAIAWVVREWMSTLPK